MRPPLRDVHSLMLSLRLQSKDVQLLICWLQ